MSSFMTLFGAEGRREENRDFLALHIPGITFMVNVPFASGSLPVCDLCNRSGRTKKVCRGRSGHTGLPWSDTYICITLDSSCFNQGSTKLDVELNAEMTEPRSDLSFISAVDKKMLTCVTCKKSNRRPEFCREHSNHRRLPYCTSYVILKDLSNKNSSNGYSHDETRTGKKLKSMEHASHSKIEGERRSEDTTKPSGNGFLDHIYESRTFLCTVSASKSSFQWLCVESAFGAVRSRSNTGTQQNDSEAVTHQPSDFISTLVMPSTADNLLPRTPYPSYNKGSHLSPHFQPFHHDIYIRPWISQLDPSSAFSYVHDRTPAQAWAVPYDTPRPYESSMELDLVHSGWEYNHDQNCSPTVVTEGTPSDDRITVNSSENEKNGNRDYIVTSA